MTRSITHHPMSSCLVLRLLIRTGSQTENHNQTFIPGCDVQAKGKEEEMLVP